MTFKVSDNQYGRPHPRDSWASFSIFRNTQKSQMYVLFCKNDVKVNTLAYEKGNLSPRKNCAGCRNDKGGAAAFPPFYSPPLAPPMLLLRCLLSSRPYTTCASLRDSGSTRRTRRENFYMSLYEGKADNRQRTDKKN